jgi:hypothetical protein
MKSAQFVAVVLCLGMLLPAAGCGRKKGYPEVHNRSDAKDWLEVYKQQKELKAKARQSMGYTVNIPEMAASDSQLAFEAAIVKYMADKGQWPETLGELQTTGYIDAIPDGVTNYDPKTGNYDYGIPMTMTSSPVAESTPGPEEHGNMVIH